MPSGTRSERAGLAEVAFRFADRHHLGDQAQCVIAEVVGQELVRPARRETDAQSERNVAIGVFRAST